MSATLSVTSILLAIAISFSAGQKLTHRAEAVAGYVRVGVREDQLNALAAILFAAAAALIAGLAWAPIGIASAAGLVVYFLVATGAHVHHDDVANAGMPIGLEILAVAVLALHLA